MYKHELSYIKVMHDVCGYPEVHGRNRNVNKQSL